jgi:hypothetical protein
LELLQVRKTLKIQDLVEELKISPMTVHRDLHRLASAGLVRKVHGGVTLAGVFPANNTLLGECALCGKPVLARTAFIIHGTNGEHLYACCSHCGLLLLLEQQAGVLALTADFLYGRMVGVQQTAYLVESAVIHCCEPSVLSFASHGDAQRFQQGFGGQVMDIGQTQKRLQEVMAISPQHHPMRDRDHLSGGNVRS